MISLKATVKCLEYDRGRNVTLVTVADHSFEGREVTFDIPGIERDDWPIGAEVVVEIKRK